MTACLSFKCNRAFVLPAGPRAASTSHQIYIKDIRIEKQNAQPSEFCNQLFLIYPILARFSSFIAIQQTHDIPPLWLNFSSEVFSWNCENPKNRSLSVWGHECMSTRNKNDNCKAVTIFLYSYFALIHQSRYHPVEKGGPMKAWTPFWLKT